MEDTVHRPVRQDVYIERVVKRRAKGDIVWGGIVTESCVTCFSVCVTLIYLVNYWRDFKHVEAYKRLRSRANTDSGCDDF